MTERSHIICGSCGSSVENPASFCDICGSPLSPPTVNIVALSGSPSATFDHIAEGYFSLPERARIFIVVGSGLLLEIVLLVSGVIKFHPLVFNILYMPLLLGGTIIVAKSDTIVSWVENLNAWLIRKENQMTDRSSHVKRFWFKPFLSGLTRIIAWTDKIDNQFFRCGLRISLSLYFTITVVYLTIIVVYVAFVLSIFALGVILFLVVLGIILLIWNAAEGNISGWSEERTGLFRNKYVQHYNEGGSKDGWSEEKTGLFGDTYIQNYDQSGSKEGWSEKRTGLFGDEYVQHYEEGGNKSAWSEERTELFGDKYTQHYDQGGSKTGRSEEKRGLFGDEYVEHHGRPSTKGSKSSR